MRISLYSFFILMILISPVLAQQLYRPNLSVNKFYYKCAAHIAPGVVDDPRARNKDGYIGIFQFGLNSAYEAGLCSNPVPKLRQQQIWKFCDFKGPVSLKYNIHDQYDLRFNDNAKKVQLEMMTNLTKKYDDYIYERKYDLFFGKIVNGVIISPDILRGLLHTKGRAAVDDFLHDFDVRDRNNESLYSLATCLNQCMVSEDKNWFCD